MVGRQVFDFLLSRGLSENDRFLDIGCGSLRLGRLMIPYLMSGNYFGLEPEKVRVQQGLKHELVDVYGTRFIDAKAPNFSYNGDFDLSGFNGHFDVILAFAVFIHCGRKQLETCLRNVKSVMTPHSIFYIDLSIEQKSLEMGIHRKYEAASHQKTAYEIEDAKNIFESHNFSFEEIHLDPHPSAVESRQIFALKLRND